MPAVSSARTRDCRGAVNVRIEAVEDGNASIVSLQVRSNNWSDEERNDAERRQGIIDAVNGLLRSLKLSEIEEK